MISTGTATETSTAVGTSSVVSAWDHCRGARMLWHLTVVFGLVGDRDSPAAACRLTAGRGDEMSPVG